MSWVGRISFAQKIRSLFRLKEQAPSSKQPSKPGLVLSDEELKAIDPLVDEWVREKLFRLPDRALSDTAARMGLTWPQLFAWCQQRTGMDFRAWRIRLRIEDAKELLLKEPEASAATIARKVGYNDRSNFTRHFQQLTGVTPVQWRSQHSI